MRTCSLDEPGAGIPHAGICEGDVGQPAVLPSGAFRVALKQVLKQGGTLLLAQNGFVGPIVGLPPPIFAPFRPCSHTAIPSDPTEMKPLAIIWLRVSSWVQGLDFNQRFSGLGPEGRRFKSCRPDHFQPFTGGTEFFIVEIASTRSVALWPITSLSCSVGFCCLWRCSWRWPVCSPRFWLRAGLTGATGC